MSDTAVTRQQEFEITDLDARIKTILQPKFVHFGPFAEALSLALASNKHVWFFGDGGYGKSDMLETAFTGLGLMDKTYVQAFGQGMTPEKLVGNLDMKTLNNKGLFRYNTDESFMIKQYAIFEEMADAPVPVLFLLKDMLQRGRFRDGTQQVDVQTKTIVVNSNRSPAAVAEYGVDAAALVQRWSIQLNVCWPSHTQKDYRYLIDKQHDNISGPVINNPERDVLAKLLADASSRGEPIPPRIALDAMRTIKTHALIKNRKAVLHADFLALSYVYGLTGMATNIKKELNDAAARLKAVTEYSAVKDKYTALALELEACKTPIPCIQIGLKADNVSAEVAKLSMTDDTTKLCTDLIYGLAQLKDKAVQKAVSCVKV